MGVLFQRGKGDPPLEPKPDGVAGDRYQLCIFPAPWTVEITDDEASASNIAKLPSLLGKSRRPDARASKNRRAVRWASSREIAFPRG